MLLKFATVLYADHNQLINLMPNHQPWLSNEIETLVNRKGRGCIYLLRAVQGVVNLSSSIKTIETNGVTEGTGNNWKKILKSISFIENIEGLENGVVKRRVPSRIRGCGFRYFKL